MGTQYAGTGCLVTVSGSRRTREATPSARTQSRGAPTTHTCRSCRDQPLAYFYGRKADRQMDGENSGVPRIYVVFTRYTSRHGQAIGGHRRAGPGCGAGGAWHEDLEGHRQRGAAPRGAESTASGGQSVRRAVEGEAP